MGNFVLAKVANMVIHGCMDSTSDHKCQEHSLDLEEYRRENRLTYQDIAERLGDVASWRARRYALGERWPRDPAVLDRIVEMSEGRVSIAAMHRRRRQFVDSQCSG